MPRNPRAARKPGAVIAAVRPGSPAEAAGLAPGDVIVAVNGQPASDIIQLHYAALSHRLELSVRGPDGSVRRVRVAKDEDEDLGVSFEDPLFDRIITCDNRCIFCFVHQSPRGMRRSLYIMDDDLRLSVLDGNFVTLTNWTEQDWRRVIDQHLSPLYISVHSTEDDLRAFLMGTDRARGIMGQLRRLADAGIVMHTQLVLCPGINDGPHLDRSIADLSTLFPWVRTVAVVPVGLTRFRRHLYPLRPYRPAEARAIVGQVTAWQRRLLPELGTRFVFAADEWYTMSGRPVPSARTYEDFAQVENGVGLVRRFLDEARSALGRLDGCCGGVRRILWVTGKLAGPILLRLAARLMERIRGLEVEVHVVENRFYGPTVTVAGLLVGQDILDALTARADVGRFDHIFLPAVALKPDEPIFLDDLPLAALQEALPAPVRALPVDGRELVRATTGRRDTADGRACSCARDGAIAWAPDGSACHRFARRSRPDWAP